jgi:hypothetical protein
MGLYSMMLGKAGAGFAQKGADDLAANQLSQEAGASVAAGVQGDEAMRRRTGYVASNAQARIASGGLATTGPSAQAVIGGIKGQGEYDALTAMYQGEDRANEIDFRANQLRTQGNNALAASVLSGASTFFDKYNGGGGFAG